MPLGRKTGKWDGALGGPPKGKGICRGIGKSTNASRIEDLREES